MQQPTCSSCVRPLAAATSGGSCSRASTAAATAAAAGPSAVSRTQRPASPVRAAPPSSCWAAAGRGQLPARRASDPGVPPGKAAMSTEALMRRGRAVMSIEGLPLRDRAATSREALLPHTRAQLVPSPGRLVGGSAMPCRPELLLGPPPLPFMPPLGATGMSTGWLPAQYSSLTAASCQPWRGACWACSACGQSRLEPRWRCACCPRWPCSSPTS